MKYLFLLGLVFYGLISGCQNLYVSTTESKITDIEYKDLIKNGTGNSWLAVKNAEFSILDTVYEESFGSIKKLYIPLAPLEEKGKVKYFLITKDKSLLKKFSEVHKIKDEMKIIFEIVKLEGVLSKHKNFQALIGGWGEVTSKIEDEIKKDEKVSDDPVFLVHNKKPDFSEGIFKLAIGIIGIVIFVKILKTPVPEKSKIPVKTVDHESEAPREFWPTTLDENGNAPVLMSMLADSSPLISRQTAYLTRVLEKLKEEYEPISIQVPIVTDKYHLTAPAQLKNKSDEIFFLYTECDEWGEKNFQTLMYWSSAIHETHPEIKILVCSEYESPFVTDLKGITDYKVISFANESEVES